MSTTTRSSSSSSRASAPTAVKAQGNSPYVKPKTRQRIYKAPPTIEVPDINEDAAERRRVLNVLAQRRYRERKRQANNPKPLPAQKETLEQPNGVQDVYNKETHCQDEALDTIYASDDVRDSSVHEPTVIFEWAFDGAHPVLNIELGLPWPLEPFEESTISTVTHGIMLTNREMVVTHQFKELGNALPVPRNNLPTTINPSSLFDQTPMYIDSNLSNFSFLDSYLLPMTELNVLRAFWRVGLRLGYTTCVGMWNMSTKACFNDVSRLSTVIPPKHLEPTTAQLTIPHHPVVGFLPWASARERAIQIFDLPDEVRPVNSSYPLAVLQLIYDMEDSAEGMRIWGPNACDPEAWEVGQVLFERWWFIFDRAVIEQSNRWRALRGAPRLHLKLPTEEMHPGIGNVNSIAQMTRGSSSE